MTNAIFEQTAAKGAQLAGMPSKTQPFRARARANEGVDPLLVMLDDALLDDDDVLRLSGWSASLQPLRHVVVQIGDKVLGFAEKKVMRPDVAAAYRSYPNSTGFAFVRQLDPTLIGAAQVTVMAVASNDDTRSVSLPICRPAATLNDEMQHFQCDTLTLTNGNVHIEGWALCKSGVAEIVVKFDDQPLGEATLGEERPDVAAKFPHMPAARTAGFRFYGHVLGRCDEEHTVELVLRSHGGEVRHKILSVRAEAVNGFLEFYGHHQMADGWLFCGSLAEILPEDLHPKNIVATFEDGSVVGDAVLALCPREENRESSQGVVIFIPGRASCLGALTSVSFEVNGLCTSLKMGPKAQRLRDQELSRRIRPILAEAPPSIDRDSIIAVLNRQPYAEQNTLAALRDRIFLELDDVILCEPNGLLLMGWFLAKPGTVRQIRLRCGSLISIIDLNECVLLERPDVLTAVGTAHGYDDLRCGFVAFLPQAVVPNADVYIEIETHRREIGFRPVPPPKHAGMAAIKHLLNSFDLRFNDIPRAFERVIGPAVERLNKSRLATKPNVSAVEYGVVPSDPRFSIIIPVYGRLDFVEYQLALFSAYPPNAECEFIYVVDDPQKRKEARLLFASLYERFRIPFRGLLLDRNVGFAPANNIGLDFAAGAYVAFVNSDVFPGTPDWLQRLATRLSAEPDLGAIGPLLLFEDGSVQHQGMYFKALDEFGGWMFGQHEAKGLRYTGGPKLRRCISITGACMLMNRSLARQVGGFDEAYVIGDFEDSDLCLKLHRMGLTCAVDPEVQLYHLERKSQSGAALNWRMNLTLYNAWVHQRRWAKTIAAYPADLGIAPVMVAA